MVAFDIVQCTYGILVYVVYSGLLTAFASGLHGGNHFSKGYIVVAHTILLPLVAPLFWLFFRGSKQARAELDILSGKGGLRAVWDAYPFGFKSLMMSVIAWVRKNPWPEVADARRQQELCGGFIIGLGLGLCSLIPLAFILD